MSDEGKQILESTRNFRKYLGDIGQLLSTAEEMLNKRGYITANDKTAVAPEAVSIEKPQKWLPQVVFRFLKHKENKHILVVISVNIDDLNEPESFAQPIVSAIWFDYGEGNEVKKGSEQKATKNTWIYKFSRIILRLKNPSLEGKMIDIFPELIKYFEDYGILSSQALAVPLVDIRSEHDIKEKIIKPLIESLNSRINQCG